MKHTSIEFLQINVISYVRVLITPQFTAIALTDHLYYDMINMNLRVLFLFIIIITNIIIVIIT